MVRKVISILLTDLESMELIIILVFRFVLEDFEIVECFLVKVSQRTDWCLINSLKLLLRFPNDFLPAF